MVLADADIDHAVNGVLYGIFSSSGESCIAGSRLFVARSLHAEFMQRLTAKAAALQVGDPADERTQMGRSEEHTSELQSPCNLVCRLLLEKKKKHVTTSHVACVRTLVSDH